VASSSTRLQINNDSVVSPRSPSVASDRQLSAHLVTASPWVLTTDQLLGVS